MLAAAILIASGIHLIPGVTTINAQPDGNSVLIDAPQGLIVIDTGRHADHTQKVIDFAHAEHRPIRAIINSHWHLDHVGGNALIRSNFPDAHVYASAAIRDAMGGFLASYRKQLEAGLANELKPEAAATPRTEIALIDSGPELMPTDVIASSGRRAIAGRPLQLYLEKAATAGDVWVFDEKTKVLIAGDLVTLPAPFFDTACADRWQAALVHLSRKPFRVLIPGHGAPMQRAQFETYRHAFGDLLSCSRDASRTKDECTRGWLDDARTLLMSADDQGYARSLISYYVDNVLRAGPQKTAELCKDLPGA